MPKGVATGQNLCYNLFKIFLKAEDIKFDIRNLFRNLFLCNANG